MRPALGILLAVCPADPFDNFLGWLFCQVLGVLGVNPQFAGGDFAAELLLSSGPTSGDCASLLEPLLGHTCVTVQMWQMTEAAGYPIIVLMIGVRYARMLAENNFGTSPGWAVADPLLRAVVAAGFVHLSYPAMVLAHSWSEQLGLVFYTTFATVGGADPAKGITAVTGLSPNGLVSVVQWIYSLYLMVLALGSLVGYQICIVLAPLAIPFWVFSPQAHLFKWFLKTAGGGLLLPVILGLGWGAVVAMTHQLDATAIASLPYGAFGLLKSAAAGAIELIFIVAGAWFMGRFIKGTTGELFESASFLRGVFLVEATTLMTSRILGQGMPVPLRSTAARLAANPRFRSWMPSGFVNIAQRHLRMQRGVMHEIEQGMVRNSQLRRVVAGYMRPYELLGQARILHNSIRDDLVAGNVTGAGEKAAMFSTGNYEQLVVRTWENLPMDRRMEIAAQAWSHELAGLGGAPSAVEMQGRANLQGVLDSVYGRGVQQDLNPLIRDAWAGHRTIPARLPDYLP